MIFFQISGPLMLLGGVLDNPWRVRVLALAVAIGVVMPRRVRRRSILSIGATAVALPESPGS